VRTKKVKLSPESVARVEEMQSELLRTRPRLPLTFEQTIEWALLRQYNRQRAVRRHAMAMRDEALEVSPLEDRARSRRVIDDE
jgi:hypothetical protein